MKKIITRTIAMLGCLLYLWVGISFAEAFIKNVQPDPQYWQYNAIVVFEKYASAN